MKNLERLFFLLFNKGDTPVLPIPVSKLLMSFKPLKKKVYLMWGEGKGIYVFLLSMKLRETTLQTKHTKQIVQNIFSTTLLIFK